MELETVNKLYLELAQFSTATTARELELKTANEQLRKALRDANESCRSAYHIAKRSGQETNWPAVRDNLKKSLDLQHEVMVNFLRPNA